MNIKVLFYTTSSGKQPFTDWANDLDFKAQSIVYARIARLKAGILGDCKQLKGAEGIWELRIQYGAGYRIYFGKKGNQIVILLTGGDKASQDRDIVKAIKYWQTYKEEDYD